MNTATVHETRHSAPIEGQPLRPLLPLLHYAEITADLSANDFVEGLLLDRAMSVVYGVPGCGKSFFMMDLALHVAAGLPWRGRTVEQRGVLYLALEGGLGIRNRIAACKKRLDQVEDDIPFAVVPVPLNLGDVSGEDVERVLETARAVSATWQVPLGLTVVDTLSRALGGGDENGMGMGSLIQSFDRIRHDLATHVSTIHHVGKESGRGPRGHTSLPAAVDTEIEVTHDKTTGTSTAIVRKQRDMESGQRFAFQLESVSLGQNRRGKQVTSCVVRTAVPTPPTPDPRHKMPKDKRAALNALERLNVSGCEREGVELSAWKDRFYQDKPSATEDARKKAFQRASKWLQEEGFVAVVGERAYVLTGTGRDKAGQSPRGTGTNQQQS